MYYVTSAGKTFPVLCLEFLNIRNRRYHSVPRERAEGFRVSYENEGEIETAVFVLPNHELFGTEPEGTVEYIDEPDEGDIALEIIEMIEEIL